MGRLGSDSKTQLAEVWPRQMCLRLWNGIQPLLRERRRINYLHASDSYLVDLVKRPMGRPRKSLEGAVGEKRGVIYDCPACVAHRRKLHLSHIRNGEPPMLRRYQHQLGKWSCEACLRVRPANDTSHAYDERCRFADGGFQVARRRKK